MTRDGLIRLARAKPQEIWDILREAAYFHRSGVCSETFDRHSLALEMWAQDGPKLEEGSMKCPQCGDTEHLYRNAEVRWNPDTEGWEQTYVHFEVECTECDCQFDFEGGSDETI